MNIELQPLLLQWARQRARLTADALAEKMGVRVEKIQEWEQSGCLTFKQAEKLAKVTHTALGYLFLPEQPDEKLAIPEMPDTGWTTLDDLEAKVEDAMEELLAFRSGQVATAHLARLTPAKITIK